jgi:hypothetical protein
MSSLKVQGNSSGAGVTTLQSANTGSSTTFTLPGTDGTNGQAITTDGSGNLSFSAVSLTTGVTGTLPIANGGTGATSASTALSNLGGINTGKSIAMAMIFGF